jgi:H/ACA ribonucleoprotein complex subunit 4
MKPPWMMPREIVVKSEDATDPNYGWDPYHRPLEEHIKHGMINLDKPPGPSSHEVTAWVKKILGVRRIGHGGTLGPANGGAIPRSPGSSR